MQTPLSLTSIADRIDTGLDHPETSRALVVFNLTAVPLNGVAVFRASMSWPRDTPLPPVLITNSGGHIVPAALTDLTEGPDAKDRPDRSQLTFSFCFAVSDIPAQGWKTYIASYTDTASPTLEDFTETRGLIVVETTRHGGDLPTTGRL